VFKNTFSPTPTDDGAFGPSKLALRMATVDVTDYEKMDDGNVYT
jgi:hypothetical protein